MSKPRSSILKATGRSVARIRFDSQQLAFLRREQVDHLSYHFGRLLTGQGTARSEWEHLGLDIEVTTDAKPDRDA